MNKIIVMFPNWDKELGISVYQFIDELYRYTSPTIVCHVTSEEYGKMKEQISSGGLNERFLSSTNNTQLGYDNSRYLITPNNDKILISDYNHPDKRGIYSLENGVLDYDPNGYQVQNNSLLKNTVKKSNWKYKVYTTETYEEIVEHYKH